MKITINNFGPIREFKFDMTKNISMIYGKNNIGKSYAITAIYLLLKSFPRIKQESVLIMIFEKYFSKYWDAGCSDLMAKMVINYKDNPQENSDKIIKSIQNTINEILEDWIVIGFFRLLESSYGNIESLKNRYSSEDFSIFVENDEFSFKISCNQINSKTRISVVLSPISHSIIVNKLLNGEEIQKVLFEIVDKIFTNFRNNNLAQYFIPAVRSGYYLGTSSFTNTLAQINQFRSELSSDTFKMPKVTVPVSDFILELSNLSQASNYNAPGYLELVKSMESNILEGSVIFHAEMGKLLYKSAVLNESYDLSVVSSMVAEISLIAGYLKFVVNDIIIEKNPYGITSTFNQPPLIFIEEPEAHLHPEVQVKLIEYFVELAKLGVKIIITTHSDYMLSKLSNILLAKGIAPTKVGSYLLNMTEKGSVLDPDIMSATSNGIEDHIFLDTADNLYREKLRILG
jgi:predicted ATP-dependent endonuclease of OLD family